MIARADRQEIAEKVLLGLAPSSSDYRRMAYIVERKARYDVVAYGGIDPSASATPTPPSRCTPTSTCSPA